MGRVGEPGGGGEDELRPHLSPDQLCEPTIPFCHKQTFLLTGAAVCLQLADLFDAVVARAGDKGFQVSGSRFQVSGCG